ncbi:MAG: hypothetical protein KM310_11555 [Clostridiales bacterium]|nr:hypothetical protein [Clostridiales bacterium]
MTQEKVQVSLAKAQGLTLLLTVGAFVLEAFLFVLIWGDIPPLHMGALGVILVAILGSLPTKPSTALPS